MQQLAPQGFFGNLLGQLGQPLGSALGGIFGQSGLGMPDRDYYLLKDKASQTDWGKNMDKFMGAQIGVVIHCEGGHVLVPDYSGAVAFDKDGKEVKYYLSDKGGKEPYHGKCCQEPVDAIVTGKVKTVDARGAEVELAEDVLGYLRASEISRDRVEDARNVIKEGDELSVMIINVDRKARSVQLSLKAKDAADQQEAMQRLSATNEREHAGTTSLGALLRAKLDNTGNTNG